MKKITIILISTMVMFLTSCSTVTKNIDTNNDKEEATRGLDYRDFQKVANKSIKSMLSSGVLNHPKGGKYILVISEVINDTMQNIDTSQLIKKIRIALLQSGKVLINNSVGASSDRMLKQLRKLRQDQEYDQKTIVAKNRLQAPDLSLSGKILQRNISIGKSIERNEYYFQLTLTSVETGLTIWEGEEFIGKSSDDSSVSW